MELNADHKLERPKIGTGILILRNGKVLLGKRKGAFAGGYYALPGGHMEWGESFGDMVRREVKEETGLEVSNIRLVSISTGMIEGKHYVNIDFACEAPEGEPELREPDRCEGWAWYDPHNLPEPLLVTSKIIIENFKRKQILEDPDAFYRLEK